MELRFVYDWQIVRLKFMVKCLCLNFHNDLLVTQRLRPVQVRLYRLDEMSTPRCVSCARVCLGVPGCALEPIERLSSRLSFSFLFADVLNLSRSFECQWRLPLSTQHTPNFSLLTVEISCHLCHLHSRDEHSANWCRISSGLDVWFYCGE